MSDGQSWAQNHIATAGQPDVTPRERTERQFKELGLAECRTYELEIDKAAQVKAEPQTHCEPLAAIDYFLDEECADEPQATLFRDICNIAANKLREARTLDDVRDVQAWLRLVELLEA